MIITNRAQELTELIETLHADYNSVVEERNEVYNTKSHTPIEYKHVLLRTLDHRASDYLAELHEACKAYLNEVKGRVPASDFDFTLD